MRFLKMLFFTFVIASCSPGKDPLQQALSSDSWLRDIANNPKYEVQILYTRIDRNEQQEPRFSTFSFGVDTTAYFYPASAVKFPAALLSLEKINRLDMDGLTKETVMLTDSASPSQQSFHHDSSAATFYPSVGHYIKKILLVSDNQAFNRLYEFLGQDEFNRSLWEKGYLSARINHRLSEYVPKPRTREENLKTNPIRFVVGDSVIYGQPLVTSRGEAIADQKIEKGRGFVRNDSLIQEPFDFTEKNHLDLVDQHNMIRAIIFPESFPENAFNLTKEDYEFLYRYMSMYPAESDIEIYQDTSFYWDSYVKFLLFGSERGEMSDHIRIFNKVGNAYGYVVDNAYIIDLQNEIEFFLSAVIHTNDNRVYNDGVYEYDEIAFPFMKILGQKIYDMELERTRRFPPDLSRFQSLYR